jgi:hypothetical protein
LQKHADRALQSQPLEPACVLHNIAEKAVVKAVALYRCGCLMGSVMASCSSRLIT